MNPDLQKERNGAKIDVESMKLFLGSLIYNDQENYQELLKFRNQLVKRIKPLYEENYYNLDRNEKYEMVLKKSLEMYEFFREINLKDTSSSTKFGLIGAVMGVEKLTFTLHDQAFKVSIDLWGTDEQVTYWNKLINENAIFGTYAQTELGHGTYLKGLETTATYDKQTQEFIIDSPTLTSIKFWPGALGKSSNYAIVMANLIIEGKEYGIQGFVVQLRSLKDHRLIKGVETGDIGKKFGFESVDNGYVKFSKLRIPRFNMLMRNAHVSVDGKFEQRGSQLIMYACMLLLRGSLCLYSGLLLSISTTIAIRYSCVRRQTVNASGEESQVIDYQTQQMRLFPALAATYAQIFGAKSFVRNLHKIKGETENFNKITQSDLAKLHAVSAGLKAVGFNNCLKYAQSNRLCCGGHGYSASSGLPQIIEEASGGCTYEGDNIVLLLQTARYLVKCAQKNVSPHLEIENLNHIKTSTFFSRFAEYFQFYYKLYDGLISEVGQRMFDLANESGQYEAWNQSTVQLIETANVYISIFIINGFLASIAEIKESKNQEALSDLLELYMLNDIVINYGSNILRLNIIVPSEMNAYLEKLFNLLPKIRVNAVAMVDSFNYLDSNLCSSLGAFDGNVYENLFKFAQNSKFNDKEVHDAYVNFLRPYSQRYKLRARL